MYFTLNHDNMIFELETSPSFVRGANVLKHRFGLTPHLPTQSDYSLDLIMPSDLQVARSLNRMTAVTNLT